MRLETGKWRYARLDMDIRWEMFGLNRRFGLFSPLSWDSCCHPSFPNFFKDLWNNAMAWLTPWFRWKRALVHAFGCFNGTKLLGIDRKSAYVRTREGTNPYYFTLNCGLFKAVLLRSHVEYKRVGGAEEEYEERTEKVLSGWCVTRGQCERLMDRIVAETPDMEWYEDA